MQAEFSNSIHSVVVSHYRVCTGKRSHKATPRAWVLEVSGVHTPKHNTTTSSAKNIAEDDSSAWVAVSVVAREETEALSLYDGKNRSCMIFDTTMNDVLSSSSKKRELWSNKVQSSTATRLKKMNRELKTVSGESSSNSTEKVMATTKVSWEVDRQCRKGNTGPLCANCLEGWARNIANPTQGCINCTTSSEGDSMRRRLQRQMNEATFPMYHWVIHNSPVQHYVQYRRRVLALAVSNSSNDTTPCSSSKAGNATNKTHVCDVGHLLSGRKSSWEILAPSVYLGLGVFLFGFFVALIGMAMPAEMDDTEHGMGYVYFAYEFEICIIITNYVD